MAPINDRFENVSLLRAFAATAVVVYHVIELTPWKTFATEGPLVTFRIGWIGVDLFFVISGFVITASALALHRNNRDEFNRKYWTRRLSRILPLYVLTGALWIAIFGRGFFNQSASDWIGQLGAHLTFTHTFWPRTFDSIDGVNWTLGIEMQFYLAVALSIPWLARTPGWRIWVCCILIAWTWRAAWPLRPLHYVGEVSYGIYLWHLFAIELLLGLGGIEPAQMLMLTLGVTLLLASVSWHFFEKPILAFGRKLSDLNAQPLGSRLPRTSCEP